MATRKANGAPRNRVTPRKGRNKPSANPREAAPTPTPANESKDTQSAPPNLFVVGIGASAGGLEALETLFDAMPPDTGLAFVVVTHQHPGHVSLLPEILARRTRMQVTAAKDHTTLEPNHVYVSAPGTNLALLHGVLQVMELAPGPGVHLPIDYFFRSLATDQGERAVCIVLSGTGTDGTLGLREIKAHSGLAIVQDEQSAHYTGMPHSAATTLLADYVLRPEQMPAELLAYAHTADGLRPATAEHSFELKTSLPKIFVLLRNRVGHDFSGYKLNTLQRRIERRMRVHQLVRFADYVRVLQSKPHEIDLLFQDLIISVTRFFRDPEAFAAVEVELINLIEREPEPVTLRAWVAGCSTGEEAYSIAMLALEAAERVGKQLQLQIFATDLDPSAIVIARAGLYPRLTAADVGPERLNRFFVAEPGGQRVRKQVRETVIFATQNILRDPPFTKLNLLSCRNLMIYLSSELQNRLLPLFHYSLKPGGILWLGTSETAAGHPDLFAPTDRKWKLYERRSKMPDPVAALDLQLLAEHRPVDMVNVGGVMRAERRAPAAPSGIGQTLAALLVKRYAPPTLVVTARGEIAYIHGRTGLFLEPSVGEPQNNVFAMARDGLRLPLQTAIHSAASSDHEIVQRDVELPTETGTQLVHIIVRRIDDPEPVRGLFRVSFMRAKAPAKTTPPPPAGGKVRARQLNIERELKQARDSLQGTLTELQTSNEELMSTNEEMQSINEELQSTNEELETSKEELQSMNEEMQTVNSELQRKVDELALVNDDMQNLLNATDIATLFLDRELKVKRFTEQARRVVRLIASDVGRPIADLVPQVRHAQLVEDAQHVLDTLLPRETEVQSLEGQWLLMRMLPYRTGQNVIDGVVVTFIDIDRLKRAEALAASNKFAESIVQTVREPLLVLDAELRIQSANRAFARLVGEDSQGLVGQFFFDVGSGALGLPRLREVLHSVLVEGSPLEAFEFSFESSRLGTRAMELNARRLEEIGLNPVRVLVGLSFAPPDGSDERV